MAAAKTNPYYQTSTSHPYGHKIRLKAVSSSYAPKYITDRSLTVNRIQITPRTVFELERPQTHGSPRLLIDINTSYYRNYLDKYKPKKRVPVFPKLATDPVNTRQQQSAKVKEDSGRAMSALSRNQNNVSPIRNDLGSANQRHNPHNPQNTPRSSSAMSNRKPSAGLRRTLSERQNTTFTAYAKYNDELKAKEEIKEIKEEIQTQPIKTLNDFVMASRAQIPLFLSNEKQLRITDWIASTTKAMQDEVQEEEIVVPKSLPVIQEL